MAKRTRTVYVKIIPYVLIGLGVIIFLRYEVFESGDEVYHDVKMSVSIPVPPLEKGEDKYESRSLKISENTYLTSITPVAHNAAAFLHHADIVYSGYADLYCEARLPYIAATGAELKAINFPEGYGLPLKKGRTLEVLMHMANQGNLKTENGSIEFRMEGVAHAKPAFPLYLSVNDYCGLNNDTYTIPAGIAHHEKTMERPFRIAKPAKLIGWGGHLHTYGASLSLLLNKKEISILKPSKNPSLAADPESLFMQSVSFLKSPVALHEGDTLDMKAVYEKPKELFYPGAMGIGYFILDFGGTAEVP